MLHEATLFFTYDTPEEATLVADSVAQELGEIAGDRTRAALDRDGRELRVLVEAEDLVALRAGLNTWTTLVEVAEETAAVGRAAR